MKKVGFCGWYLVLLVIILVFSFSFPVTAQKVYYVATTGNDSNPGTLKQPFATWQKAINAASAGDTIYLRGGIYRVSPTATLGVTIAKDGTPGNPICLFNYPGENPILDMGNNTNESSNMHCLFMNDADYWHIKGIEIRDLVQTPSRNVAGGLSMQYCEHVTIENVKAHKLGFIGFYAIYSDDILFLNCDAYDVYDSASIGANADGGNADGWHISYLARTDTITLRGCRMWDCSDDGIDCFYSDGVINMDSCWSFRNGRGAGGGGNGYKLGPGWKAGATTDTLRFIYRNLAFDNTGMGYSDNTMSCAFLYYNNASFRNGSIGYRNYSNYAPDIFKNNISYLDKSPQGLQSVDVHVNNSWNASTGVSLSNADFISLDTTGVTGKRKPDGSLPDINFLKLKIGSDIINVGKDVGLPFEESAPDLGAYEYKSTITIPVTGIVVSGGGGKTTITTDNGTLQLSASVLPSGATNKTVTWSITNGTGQATINTSGLITAVSNGIVTARATANDGSGVFGTLVITISNQIIPVTNISVTGANTIIADGGTLQLSATVLPANATNKNVTWSAVNGTGQATISSTGLVTAVANGTVTVRATSIDGSGVYGTFAFTISNQIIPVTGISVTGANILTTDGGTLQLSATILPANATNKNVTWTIVNGTGKATISGTGLITAVNNGTVTAKATANDGSGVSGSITITIQQPVTPVANPKEIYIDPTNNTDPSQDGSIEHPYSSWSMVTWKEGYAYMQKKGTVSNVTKINIGASDVVLGYYGEGDQPVIQSDENDFAIRAFEKNNILIKGLKIINTNGVSCIYIIGETCDSICIENCTLESTENGVRILNGKNVVLRYNTFINCSNAIFCYAENSSIYYNVFRDNGVAINTMANMARAEIFNNVFYNNVIGISNTYSELTLYNNIFYLANKTDKALNDEQLNKLISDNNIFYPEQEGFIKIGNKVYSSLSDYQQDFGLDLHSITQDPKFVDVYNHNFSIEPYSPAVNTGKLLGLQQDFFGTAVPSGGFPDIGLVELKNPSGSVTSTDSHLNDPIQDDFQVYPNPSQGVFNVYIRNNNSKTSKITIKDLSGKNVYESNYSSDLDFLQEINISTLQKGIYIVVVEDNIRSLSQPIIIK